MKTKHLYIHVPFCKTICSYCDFCHQIYNKDTVNKWLDTIALEIKEKCEGNYETIYIGGGTPTSLTTDELEKLLSLIKPYTNNILEYTIEVNPESLDLDKVKLFNEYGINRISMGVQTSNNDLLKMLIRHHTFDDAKDKIQLLKDNGLNNISIDLMYSLPNQTLEMLDKTIEDFILLDIPHVSIYSLNVEENTVFGKKGITSLDEEIEADMYEMIINKLEKAGYRQYEVSNFSKEGFKSKHNIAYWKYEDFLGISLGASSKLGNLRYTNTRNFNEYFIDYNSKSEDLILTKKDMMFENIMMSLRMKDGLNIDEFNNRYDTNLLEVYKDALENNNLSIENGCLKVKDLEILNNTLLDFMD